MKLTGAEIVVECLKEQGVDTVFGYPGGAIDVYKRQSPLLLFCIAGILIPASARTDANCPIMLGLLRLNTQILHTPLQLSLIHI